MQKNTPTLETLRRLRPLAEFESSQLLALAQQLDQKTARKKECILELGSTSDSHVFILSGEVNLISADGKINTKAVNDEQDLNPIAQLRPSMYSVTATQLTQYLLIPKALMTAYSSLNEPADQGMTVDVQETSSITDTLTFQIGQDMMTDKLSLPSLPEIALKIQNVYRDDLADINSISEILISDPAITAKLIKIANSLVYQGEVPTETLKSAIMRLGLDTTYKQVMAYAVNDLFNSSSPSLKQRMTDLWSHSRKVAAISRLMADQTQLFNPDQAMLAGLVHDLGVIVILEYIEGHELEDEDADIEHIINTLRSVITSMLMKKWNFTSDIISVAEQCEEWFRNESDEADLCDLVMIAQYHSYIGSETIGKLPPITSIPAMKKLNLNAKDSIELIKNSRDEIRELETMLS